MKKSSFLIGLLCALAGCSQQNDPRVEQLQNTVSQLSDEVGQLSIAVSNENVEISNLRNGHSEPATRPLDLQPLAPASATTPVSATASAPVQLRAASFSCDQQTIDTATALKQAGWTYIMPEPKSPQAAWGNTDGRTTWWVGYWQNSVNQQTSSTQPQKNEQGQFIGDGNGYQAWRRGGTPSTPTKVEWLCSESDGVEPE